jgi:hypothetical protein
MDASSGIIVSDPIWFEDFTILFREDRFLEFFISKDLTFEEKLNSIVRLGIYISIMIALYKNNPKFLLISIIPSVFTYFVYKNFSSKDYSPEVPDKYIETYYRKPEQKKILEPTVDNPFMNYNIVEPLKGVPQNYSKNDEKSKELRKTIEDKFSNNIYRDVDDVFDRNNSKRQFYTVPPLVDDGEYKNFLFGGLKSGKEDQYQNGRNLHEPLQTSNRNSLVL